MNMPKVSGTQSMLHTPLICFRARSSCHRLAFLDERILSSFKDASSIEEVKEVGANTEEAPPLGLPREDSGMGESGEEFQVGAGDHSSYLWTPRYRQLTSPF